ncbi:MAG: nitroreductase family protein [Solobacterium sp.]|nr:nitroreductase family protein [Solobacterium sp.]
MSVKETILNRRSVRKYTKEMIPDEMITEVVQAGLLAPSSRNLRSSRAVIVTDKRLLRLLSACRSAGASMLRKCACAIVVYGDESLSDAWIEDCSIMMSYMQLRAQEMGLGSCWVQCRNRISAQNREKAIPEDIKEEKNVLVRAKRLGRAALPEDMIAERNMTTDEYIRTLFGLQEHERIEAVLALGYPDEHKAPYTEADADMDRVTWKKQPDITAASE